MNNATQNARKQTSPADGAAGSIYVDLVLGAIFGGAVSTAWKAAETADNIWTDRRASAGKFELGAKNSLGLAFAVPHQTIAEQDRSAFVPFMKPAPIFSARSFA